MKSSNPDLVRDRRYFVGGGIVHVVAAVIDDVTADVAWIVNL